MFFFVHSLRYEISDGLFYRSSSSLQAVAGDMTKLCLLLAAACVPLIHSAAVLDLINLFHQYEDDILGRGQGVNPEPLEIEEETEAGVIRKLYIHTAAQS